jgi:cardiolipin synthase A/B
VFPWPCSPASPAQPARRSLWGGLRAASLAAATSCLLAACAVPDADKSIAKSTEGISTTKPKIQGAQGPLTAAESKALLTKIGNASGDDDILQRHLAIEEAVAGSPLTADNAVTVLRDGPETFKAILAAIQGAKHSLNLEYYTIEDVRLEEGGAKLSDVLIAKRREGVAVNIIYDSYGSSDTPAEFFTRLEEAGVNLLAFHPIAPTSPENVITINRRDHRKILVADGEVAVVGGVNLSKDYESKSPGSDKADDDAESETPATAPGKSGDVGAEQDAGASDTGQAVGLTDDLPEQWLDTAAQIEGPAVAELQRLFRDHWRTENGPPLDDTLFFPDSVTKGKQVVRIIGSAPDDEIPRYYVTLISSLRNAESRAWISAAYFVPTPEQTEELTAAAKRGVDVRLLLADDSDSPQAIEAARTHYTDLLRAGIKIYETKNVILHSKTVVIDGVWSAIGSSNFDHRSVLYNDEVEAIILGIETADELEEIFARGMSISDEIDPATWEENRPFAERFRGFFSRVIENLL